MATMKIIGIEEHIALPELLDAWAGVPGIHKIAELGYGDEPLALRLRDVADRRLVDMADMGVDMQVLSISTPGVSNLPVAESVRLARVCNDALAKIVSGNPTRFQALAAIPTPDPEAAASELLRAITQLGFRGAMIYGRTGTVNADDARFDELYATAARLGAPLYLHPQTPQPQIIDTYYKGFGQPVDFMFATFGIGWYYDNFVQLLRMIFGGVFDRHPNLQVIIGHMGDIGLFYLDHVVSMETSGLKLPRPLMDYFKQNVWVTGSGLLSERYLRLAADTIGTDRLMYSTDYPFTYATPYPVMDTSQGKARTFLESAPFSEAEKIAIGSGNWEKLTDHLALPTPTTVR